MKAVVRPRYHRQPAQRTGLAAMSRRLALFDLDNTLLAGDSDHAWGDFLVERGIVDGQYYKDTNDRFYQDYCAGRLDIRAYLAFALQVLAEHSREQLQHWHREFMREKVEPLLLPKALALVDEHRRAGDALVIITATNDFVTQPIADRFGVHALIATTAELANGRYTGRVAGTPCYREGKVTRLHEWLAQHPHTLEGSVFYSDSHTDLPLLEIVSTPVAVDPNNALRAEAEKRGWEIRSLR
jgi:HAD superfamily hydrolase (TIGR01490 family)